MTDQSPRGRDDSLPADSAGEPDRAASVAGKSGPPGVLVVDDDSLTRWAVTETLHEGGYRVTEVHNAAAAMDALSCSAAPFAVVLLDMRLPDSGDLSVLAAMHTMRPATPVIVMTAHGSPELAQDARHLGAFAIVDKPFEMTDLVPLIERALGGIPIERRL